MFSIFTIGPPYSTFVVWNFCSFSSLFSWFILVWFKDTEYWPLLEGDHLSSCLFWRLTFCWSCFFFSNLASWRKSIFIYVVHFFLVRRYHIGLWINIMVCEKGLWKRVRQERTNIMSILSLLKWNYVSDKYCDVSYQS